MPASMPMPRPDLATISALLRRPAIGSAAALPDVACLILIKATIGQFLPVFGDGTTLAAIASASLLLWGVHFLVLRGIKGASRPQHDYNLHQDHPDPASSSPWPSSPSIPSWSPAKFLGNRAAERGSDGVRAGPQHALLLTVFVFVGIEGASVYSRYARDRSDIGIATVVGFVAVLSLLVLVTLLSYGVMPRQELGDLSHTVHGRRHGGNGRPLGGHLHQRGAADLDPRQLPVLVAACGRGAALRGSQPHHALLSSRARTAHHVPAGALWLTNCVIQALLLVTWFAEYAFTLALKMTSSMTLIPYLFVAAFGLRLAHRGETYHAGEPARIVDWIRSAVATPYAAGMIYAGGPKFLLLSAITVCARDRCCSSRPNVNARKPSSGRSKPSCSQLSRSPRAPVSRAGCRGDLDLKSCRRALTWRRA